jgi:hypothetical protein
MKDIIWLQCFDSIYIFEATRYSFFLSSGNYNRKLQECIVASASSEELRIDVLQEHEQKLSNSISVINWQNLIHNSVPKFCTITRLFITNFFMFLLFILMIYEK